MAGDFAKLIQSNHERAIDTHVPALTEKLIAARRKQGRQFFKDAKKSSSASMSQADFDALVAAVAEINDEDYVSAIYDAQELLAEVGWNNAKALINVSTGFDVVPTAVLDRLKSDAGDVMLKVTGREKQALTDILTQAFQGGLSTQETTALVKEAFAVYHLDSGSTLPVDVWSEMVARTELSNAANEGMMSLYADAGVQKIEWLAANSPSTCDECQEADGAVVNLGEAFPYVDVDSAPAHPRCCCSSAPADEDLGDFRGTDEERARAARGGYSADEYESKFGYTHPIDSGD